VAFLLHLKVKVSCRYADEEKYFFILNELSEIQVSSQSWKDLDVIKGNRKPGLIKKPNGELGVGLFDKGWNDDIGGSVAWENGNFESGFWWNKDKNFLFSLIKL